MVIFSCCLPSEFSENARAPGKTNGKHELALPGKKGACFALAGKNGQRNLSYVKAINPSWNYSWSVDLPNGQTEDMEWIPQVWGSAKSMEEMRQRLEKHIVPLIKSGKCKRVLAFNEPDKAEQSNMTVEKCIEFWPLLQELGVPLCSPSCANPLGCTRREADDCTQGVTGAWMKDFMDEIEKRGYRCDYVGVHWYGGPSANIFKAKMKEIYEAYGCKYPLLITEFAVADWSAVGKSCKDNKFSQTQVVEFMKQVLPWLEQQDWIVGYAWFPFEITRPEGSCSALFTTQGQMTACGRYYQSVTTNNPRGNQEEKVWAEKRE
jgi:hypothetical protein